MNTDAESLNTGGLGNGSATEDRVFHPGPLNMGPLNATPLAPFRTNQRRDPLGGDGDPRRNGAILDGAAPLASVLDSAAITEPVLGDTDWLVDGPAGAALADHPLLRGLLLELPPKGIMPTGEWLDRWFEAARSILELLYAQHVR